MVELQPWQMDLVDRIFAQPDTTFVALMPPQHGSSFWHTSVNTDVEPEPLTMEKLEEMVHRYDELAKRPVHEEFVVHPKDAPAWNAWFRGRLRPPPPGVQSLT